MKLTSLLLQLFLTSIGSLAVSLPWASAQDESPINIVLIFADDLGYGDVGIFNPDGPFETPRLDRMAREGMRLTQFYVPTPYCAPSRGTILTGRYPFRHTVVRNPAPDAGQNNIGLPQSEITIAELLKENGYATAAYGKWHLGHLEQWLPRTQGFDEYYGILYSNDMYPVQLVHNETVVEYPVIQAKLTRDYTDRAIDFMERNRDRPFFIYLPQAMPHKPLAASDDFYTPDTPENLYADVIRELDHSVGQVLDAVKRLGLDRKTLVIFTSDNGASYGGSTGGLRGMKGRIWDGGLKVPFIARLPGLIPVGKINDSPVASIDMLPTLSALTGVAVPTDRTIDGKNMLPLLKDPNVASPHEAIFGMSGAKLACIRSGQWKLHVLAPGPSTMRNLNAEESKLWVDPRAPDGVTILAPFEQARPSDPPGLTTGDSSKTMMLFNLNTDPGEQHDVANQYPEVVQRLKRLFEKTNAEVPDFPTPKSDYQFKEPARGEPRKLMHLIGGELRYDRIPAFQQGLVE